MPDDIEFTMPGETASAETAPVIDHATGEPSLAQTEPVAVEGAGTEPAKVEPTKAADPDATAALAVAAKASREAREAKRALEAANAELEKLKAAPADDYKSKYEAIKKNPSLLYSEGWDADRLMKLLLNPDEALAPEPIDPEKIKADILAAIKESQQETPEQKAAREAAEKANKEQNLTNGANFAKSIIKTESEKYFWVDDDDARPIVEKVVAFCNQMDFVPTREQAADLIRQGITKLHAKREARYAKRTGGSASQSPSQSQELGFTDGSESSSRKLVVVPEPAKPTPRVPTTSGNPLPTRTPSFEIGFTK